MPDPERPSFDDYAMSRAVDVRSRTIEEQFIRFHRSHPEVYAEIVAECRRVRAAGHRHWSIDGAFEVVRYFRYIRPDAGEAFKLNNSYRSHYARLVMQQEPDLAGMFEVREMRSA